MSHAACPTRRNQSVAARSAALLVAASLGGFLANAAAQVRASAPQAVEVLASTVSLADLENTFWACDHAATVSGIMDARTAIECGTATEHLKLKKFGGDFNAMLGWWQQNKSARYQALDDALRTARLP